MGSRGVTRNLDYISRARARGTQPRYGTFFLFLFPTPGGQAFWAGGGRVDERWGLP